ncbi:phospholipase D-like protein [Motilibacter rhizosphaerae]|uniref:Phospholipase D-like protein n=1 Tax=Motilibacter rhizosphaerae TaxID=598652 RepID=A0A4Q7NA32_9ACTN|nr:PLD nuclease N-terminal domain-containing protein [Motilibacter rhizosphaerae]RZS79042.1 phospholipase D-like protein [Motilibacter rhizosphaerae]
MLRFLPELLGLVLVVWALVDCITTPEEALRGLPKVLWVLLILLFPLVGALVYLFAGRARVEGAGTGWSAPQSRPSPRQQVAPDDDPAFLERLRLHKWEQELRERERRLREDEDGPGA